MIQRLDAFMARAAEAYYATHDPFTDFTTAPEISQVFGEVLGLWAAVTWDMIGRPAPVMLVEAGPGRGTLMADALRSIGQAMPAFGAAMRLHLIEASPRLRAIQAARLPEAIWHDRIDTLPGGPLILLANEFLDALPIRQFIRRGDGWTERYAGPDGAVEMPSPEGPGALNFLAQHGAWDAGPAVPGLPGKARTHEIPDGTVIERGEAARAFVSAIAARITHSGGAALFLDYGPEFSGPGDSLQAIAGGRPADPFAAPGQADITAHVDFAALAQAAREAGAAVHGPVPQGLFLARLGLFQRTERLARRLAPADAMRLTDTARRLAEPNRMGRLFKAIALSGTGDNADPPTGNPAIGNPILGNPVLAGFEPD